ncbi:MAG: hypothetical protein RL122_1908 [Pseudomonadota bacterium]|jgi:hypothetical protein
MIPVILYPVIAVVLAVKSAHDSKRIDDLEKRNNKQ